LAVAITGEAAAADIEALIDYRSDNRSGTRASTGAIGELIAERTQSDAVRRRVQALRPQGSLDVGVNELLQDIGAHRMIGRLAGVGGPVATPVPMQRPGTPSSAAAATVVEQPSARETRSRESTGRNWNTDSSGFFGSATADRGNADNSGGGVSSASSGDRASSDGGGRGGRGSSVSSGGGGPGYGFSGSSGVGGFSGTP